MFLKRFVSAFITALLIALPVAAQTPAATQPAAKTEQQQKEEAQKKLTAQAVELLEAVVKDSERLTLAQNRVYILTGVADLLWEYNEQEARAIFKNVMADLRVLLNTPPEEGTESRIYRQKIENAQLRQSVLFSLARHDARLARDFMAETRPPASDKENQPAYGPLADENTLELMLAQTIAANDPAQALEMAQKSLAKGFTYQLPNLLTEIQKKDSEGATTLASDILSKLKSTTKLSENQEAINVATRLLYIATEGQKDSPKAADKKAQPLMSEQSLRELADLILAAALNAAPEFQERYLDISSIMPQLEKYAPSRAAQLRRKRGQEAEESENLEEETQALSWSKYQETIEKGTPEEILAMAGKVPDGMRSSYYEQAAFKFAKDGKDDLARQIMNERITDPEQRKRIKDVLDKQMLQTAAEQGKLEKTRQMLAGLRTNEERIMTLSELAMSIADKGDKKTALQLLQEARNLSPNRTGYSRQFLARMQLARAYAHVDPEQSFAILEPSIDQMNELIAAGIVLGEFFGEEEVLKDDELMVEPFFGIVGSFQRQYAKDLKALAQADFTRLQDAAEKFQRYEVRLVARILIAQSILSKETDEDSSKTRSASPGSYERSID